VKKDIRALNDVDLNQLMISIGEKSFRTKQVSEWLWQKSARSIHEMTNLSLQTREKLDAEYAIFPIVIEEKQNSNDGTIKYKLKLHDGQFIEAVLIPTPERVTACISSQVGCSLTCKFCATSYIGRKRNLTAAEIYDQVFLMMSESLLSYNIPLSNVVFMGMGEPLLNYNSVIEGINKITSEKGLNFGAKRITLSTAGIAKMIKKLADDNVKVNLALSLHAANDDKRNTIMPITDTNSLKSLSEALQYYYQKTKNRITFEYIIFKDINDSLTDAKELFEFTKKVPSKINIIEYNPIEQADYVNTSVEKMEAFKKYLVDRGLIVNIRRSRGKDIDAACGQLAGK